LLELNEKVKDKLKIIMRVYIQKPRTAKGWTGPINQPDPKLPADIEKGIVYCRKLMTEVVEMGLPIADEALFTHNARGFLELLSWVAIGARSGEDQEHRVFASSLGFPVGIKNPTHGSLKVGVNSIVAAQHQHVAVFDGYEVETAGNHYAHLVLRGGDSKPNYQINFIQEAYDNLLKAEVLNPAIMVDVSHDNCMIDGKKDFRAQADVIFSVLESIKDKPELKKVVKGFMFESFLKEGSQNIDTVDNVDLSGLSITDPCLGWDKTESLILDLARKVGE
jgi:3-deoxy-7-phosphoheptulonate synthase